MRFTDTIARPAVEVVEFTDPTISNAGIELIDQDAVLLESMPLRVRRIIVRLESAAVVLHSANQRVRSSTCTRPNLRAYVVFGPQVRGTMNGLPAGPGVMLAAEPRAEARFVTEPGWQSISVMVNPHVFRQHLATRECHGDFRAPHGVEMLKVNGEKVGELFDWGKRLTDTAARQPDLFNDRPDLRKAVQVEMFEQLIATLRGTGGAETTRSDRKRQTYSLMVKYVEEYALARIFHSLATNGADVILWGK